MRKRSEKNDVEQISKNYGFLYEEDKTYFIQHITYAGTIFGMTISFLAGMQLLAPAPVVYPSFLAVSWLIVGAVVVTCLFGYDASLALYRARSGPKTSEDVTEKIISLDARVESLRSYARTGLISAIILFLVFMFLNLAFREVGSPGKNQGKDTSVVSCYITKEGDEPCWGIAEPRHPQTGGGFRSSRGRQHCDSGFAFGAHGLPSRFECPSHLAAL